MKILGLAGGSASGKSTLAKSLCERVPASAVISLDDYFLSDRSRGPWTAPDEAGRHFFDVNHPDAVDLAGVLGRIDAAEFPLLIVEGHLALHFPLLRERMTLKVFLSVPDDIRLGRKIVRNYRERGTDPAVTFQNYLNSGRPGHERIVAPSMQHADFVLDGLHGVDVLAGQVLIRLGSI